MIQSCLHFESRLGIFDSTRVSTFHHIFPQQDSLQQRLIMMLLQDTLRHAVHFQSSILGGHYSLGKASYRPIKANYKAILINWSHQLKHKREKKKHEIFLEKYFMKSEDKETMANSSTTSMRLTRCLGLRHSTIVHMQKILLISA